MLFDILSQCHHRIAHGGRQKTEKWIAENYSEVTEKVVNTFVSLCRFHGEQKPITTRVKPVVQMKLKHSFPGADPHRFPPFSGKRSEISEYKMNK